MNGVKKLKKKNLPYKIGDKQKSPKPYKPLKLSKLSKSSKKIHIGPRGGKYIIFNGKKVYV